MPDFSHFASVLIRNLPSKRQSSTPLPATLACARCHRLRGQVSWASADAWNHVVTLVSGGLRFGHEVARPPSLKATRKLTHQRKSPTNRPAPKRQEVEQRLLPGWNYPMIARDLGISQKTVAYHTRAAKRADGCPTRQP